MTDLPIADDEPGDEDAVPELEVTDPETVPADDGDKGSA